MSELLVGCRCPRDDADFRVIPSLSTSKLGTMLHPQRWWMSAEISVETGTLGFPNRFLESIPDFTDSRNEACR